MSASLTTNDCGYVGVLAGGVCLCVCVHKFFMSFIAFIHRKSKDVFEGFLRTDLRKVRSCLCIGIIIAVCVDVRSTVQ